MRLPNLLRAMPHLRPPPGIGTMLACGVLAMAGFVVVCGAVLVDARHDAARRAGQTASQLVAAVAQDIAHGIGGYDVALQALIAGLRIPGTGQLSTKLRNFMLFDRATASSNLSFIEALDANGDVIAEPTQSEHATNWANRDYFIVHRRDPAPELHVSRPFAPSSEGLTSVALSRRITDPDGNFAGVAVAGLRLSYFREMFNRLDLGPHASIVLLRDDGTILMRLPFDRNDVGRMVEPDSPFGSYLRTGATQFAATDPADNIGRQFAFSRIGELPLVLGIGAVSDSPYANWWFVWLLIAGCPPGIVTLLLLQRLWRELRGREAAERESLAKASLLATLSHELRTPLHGILGSAEQLMAEGRLDPMQTRRVAGIVSTGQHMRSVIDWAMDAAWIEARGPELHTTRVDIVELVEQCRAIEEPNATARRLPLRCTMSADAPRWFVTDGALLRQIMLNLLDNAVKYTRQGAIELRVGCLGDEILLEVADTGKGIPAEQRHKLFHQYERLGAEDSAIEGSGLGLAIVARLVRRMGGTVGHRDNPGGGSVFWLRLPPGEPIAARLPSAVTAGNAAIGSLHVLVVDDTAISRDVATAFLRTAGHEVVQAADGTEAVRLAASHDLDVVLMDVRMAGIDGLEAARRIHAIDGPRGEVPIIAMTANALDRQVAECERAGMVAHLPKPFSAQQLAAIVARVVMQPPAAGPPGSAPCTGLDPEVLEQLVHCMGADALDGLLHDLTRRIEDFLAELTASGPLDRPPSLIDMAHELAGSAGTLGLPELSDVARRFQHAAEADPREAHRLRCEIRATAEAALRALAGNVRAGSSHYLR